MNLSTEFRPTECKTWLDGKGFGFLHNPNLDDDRTIFCHVSKLPVRPATYPRLFPGDRVEIKFSADRQGRLKVDELRFIDPPKPPQP